MDQSNSIHWTGEAWLVLGYEEAAAAFREPRLGSARLGKSPLEKKLSAWILFQDGGAHEQQRAELHKLLPRTWLEAHRAPFFTQTQTLLRAKPTGPIEAVAEIAKPMQAYVTDLLLGTDFLSLPEFHAHIDDLMDFLLSSSPDAERTRKAEQSFRFLEKHLENSLFRQQAPLLAVAGIFLRNLISCAVSALATDPALFAQLRVNPSLIPSAVQEFVRYFSPSQFTSRIALDNFRFFGHEIQKGQRVSVAIGAANRDPKAFQDPEKIILSRSPNRHLGWGVGPHACSGAMFSSAVLEEVLRAVCAENGIGLVRETWLQHPIFKAPALLEITFSR